MTASSKTEEKITDLESLYKTRLRGPKGPFPNKVAMWQHLPFLHHLVLDTNALQVVELGVNTGQSTVAFLAALKKTGGNLWSCDIELPLPPIDRFLDEEHWHFVLGDSQEAFDTAPLTIDILLIDAALENRLKDLRLYGPWVRRGGYILVHDTKRPAVAEAVKKYLDDKIWTYTELQTGPGMGIIHVI